MLVICSLARLSDITYHRGVFSETRFLAVWVLLWPFVWVFYMCVEYVVVTSRR